MQAYDSFPHISVDGSFLLDECKTRGCDGVRAAADQESGVLTLLDTINGTQSGRDLFSQIEDRCKRFDKSLAIVPFSIADREKHGIVNSFPAPESWLAATRKGQPIFRGGEDNKSTPQDERFITSGTGKGGGTSVSLHFDPFVPYWGEGPIGSDPDEVLFHEMVHALRMLQGELEAVPTGTEDSPYNNLEEFLAVLMANIYISEKDPKAQLRGSHDDFTKPLPDQEATSSGFLLNNLENLFWIQHLYPHETRYYHAVTQNAKPQFNPIREYVNNQKSYDIFLASIRGSSVPTTRYTVQQGDTLKSIAKSYYHDESKWTVIVAVNSRLRRANQQDLPAGLELEIPVMP
jgi:hypothetical protein